MWIRLAAGLTLLLSTAFLSAGDAPTARNWRRAMQHVLPTKEEQRWRKVGWHATLWDAVIEAQRDKKPILLWAMNGHALACT